MGVITAAAARMIRITGMVIVTKQDIVEGRVCQKTQSPTSGMAVAAPIY
jgi:hypothetical protein